MYGSENAVRLSAAKKLGKLNESDLQVVQALVAAMKSDTSSAVQEAAEAALNAPVHQEILQQHPG